MKRGYGVGGEGLLGLYPPHQGSSPPPEDHGPFAGGCCRDRPVDLGQGKCEPEEWLPPTAALKDGGTGMPLTTDPKAGAAAPPGIRDGRRGHRVPALRGGHACDTPYACLTA